jgi:hypothetical protein
MEELARLRLQLIPGGSPEDPGAPIGSVPARPYPRLLRPLAQLGLTLFAAVWGAATVTLVLSLTSGGRGAVPSVVFVIASSACIAFVVWIAQFLGLVVTARSQSRGVVLAVSAAFAAVGGLLAVVVGGYGLGWAQAGYWPWVNGGALVAGLVVAMVVRVLGAKAAERRHVDVEGMVARIERLQPEWRGQLQRYDEGSPPQGRYGIAPLAHGGFAVHRRTEHRDAWLPAVDDDGAPIVLADEASASRFFRDEWAALTAPRPPTSGRAGNL